VTLTRLEIWNRHILPGEMKPYSTNLNSNSTLSWLHVSGVDPKSIEQFSYHLKLFTNLETLEISGMSGKIEYNCENLKDIMNALKDHPKLKKLQISDVNFDGCTDILPEFLQLADSIEMQGCKSKKEQEHLNFVNMIEHIMYKNTNGPESLIIYIGPQYGRFNNPDYRLRISDHADRTYFIQQYEPKVKKFITNDIQKHHLNLKYGSSQIRENKTKL